MDDISNSASAPPPHYPTPPPVIAPSAPPTPPRKGCGSRIFLWVVVLLFLLSLLGNVAQFLGGLVPGSARHSHAGGPRIEESVMEDNDAAEKIAVVDVSGIISSHLGAQSGSSQVELIRAELKEASEDVKVKAVVLRVDSPGGEVLASDEINRAIAAFQKKSGKPVVASMGNLAASGGYYISVPCRWIVANEMTLTGSIGVIMHTYNYRGLMDKVGVAPLVFKSGKHKDMLSGERMPGDIPDDERPMVQALIDETYGQFKHIVRQGRADAFKQNDGAGKALSDDWEDYADGRILSGRQALESGFVDQLGNFQVAVDAAKHIAGIKNADLVQYQERYDLGDFLRLFNRTQTPAIKVDLGMDGLKIESGQLYFLAPTSLR